MSTAASRPPRRRSALDRLSTPAPDVDTGAPGSVDPTPDPPASSAWPDGGWGFARPPAWLEPLGPEDRPSSDAADGDEFGASDDEETSPRRLFAIAPPAAIALILVGVLACAVAGFALLRGGSEPPVSVAFPASPGPTTHAGTAPPSPSPQTSAPPDDLVVSVVGLVHRPGLIHLPPDARVADAIDRAGGARKNADLLSLNLAQRLRDGDQILVGYTGGGGRLALRSAVVGASAGAGDVSSGTGASAPTTSGGPAPAATVDLNTATEDQLDALPGVGPVTARAIIAWRETHGRFDSVEQLAEVDGIGPARLAKLRELVTV
ncbi:helix-hairpin-helix domain-containing protein [Gordonia rhizosphera]|uniref:Putative DNA-binding protein n=1 Tax=Gordonia rhizosphera NBRC 16068 TaxID=1108045 RepID=K6WEF9_9ACTN|nr:helix-hairpin-helix domain-containing protein [Gordonia rhizosphera]GAB90572.1 putative DNA-binding protein [Gordonia rhizosphera NBRC 16068]